MKLKKVTSLFLTGCLVITGMNVPQRSLAAGVGEKDTSMSSLLDVSASQEAREVNWNQDGDIAGISDPTVPTSYQDAWNGSYLYFGEFAGYKSNGDYNTGKEAPVKYKVLDAKTTEFNAEKTMFLEKDSTLGTHILWNVYRNVGTTTAGYYGQTYQNEWKYSNVYFYLNSLLPVPKVNSSLSNYPANYRVGETTYSDSHRISGVSNLSCDYNKNETYGYLSTAFNQLEQEAIAESGDPGHVGWTPDYSSNVYEYQSLSGEKIFLLDAREVLHKNYGFYIKEGKSSSSLGTTDRWLRSRSSDNEESIALWKNDISSKVVYSNNNSFDLCPAFNLKLSSILFTKAAGTSIGVDEFAAVSESSSKEWTAVIEDGNDAFQAELDGDEIVSAGSTVNLKNISNATTGGDVASTQISAMLVDGKQNVVAYGKIADANAQTAAFTIPEDLDAGEYTLKVFSEKVVEGNYTDYASNMVDITLKIPRDTVDEKYTVNLGAQVLKTDGVTGWDQGDKSIVYVGQYAKEGEDKNTYVKYRILDSDGKYALLDCENVLTNEKFDDSTEAANTWKNSSLKSKLNLIGTTNQGYLDDSLFFTEAERKQIRELTSSGMTSLLAGAAPFSLLNAKEAQAYYTNDNDRTKEDLEGQASPWWLRSAKDGSAVQAENVGTNGKVSSAEVTSENIGVSPAFYLDLSNVFLTVDSDAKSEYIEIPGKPHLLNDVLRDQSPTWTLTFKDDSLETPKISGLYREEQELGFQYDCGEAEEGKVLVALVTDAAGEKVNSYGRIAHLDTDASGKTSLKLPDNFDTDKMNLQIFVEKTQGNNYTSTTAGEPLPINVSEAKKRPHSSGRDQKIVYTGEKINLLDSDLNLFTKEGGDAEFTIVSEDSDDTEDTTKTTGGGTIDGSGLTVTKAGTFQISMTTDESDDYIAGEAVTAVLTVEPGEGQGSVSVADIFVGEEVLPKAVSSTNGTTGVTYQYKNLAEEDAEYSMDVPSKAGTYSAMASFAATDVYKACTASAIFEIRPLADFQTGEVQVSDITVDYDGEIHKLTPKIPTNAAISYRTTEEEEYTETEPGYAEVGVYPVYYLVEQRGYHAVTGNAIITILAVTPEAVTTPAALETEVPTGTSIETATPAALETETPEAADSETATPAALETEIPEATDSETATPAALETETPEVTDSEAPIPTGTQIPVDESTETPVPTKAASEAPAKISTRRPATTIAPTRTPARTEAPVGTPVTEAPVRTPVRTTAPTKRPAETRAPLSTSTAEGKPSPVKTEEPLPTDEISIGTQEPVSLETQEPVSLETQEPVIQDTQGQDLFQTQSPVSVDPAGQQADNTSTLSPVQETPAPTTKPTAKPSVTKGKTVQDKATGASYKITKVSANGTAEVSFTGSSKSKKKVVIPNTVTLPDGTVAKVTSIASNAFKNNQQITTISIGDNVKTIGSGAFAGAKNLKTVSLGNKVSEIGKNAFKGCGKLKSITIKSTKIKSIGSGAFQSIPKSAVVKLPKKLKKSYQKMLKKSGYKGKIA